MALMAIPPRVGNATPVAARNDRARLNVRISDWDRGPYDLRVSREQEAVADSPCSEEIAVGEIDLYPSGRGRTCIGNGPADGAIGKAHQLDLQPWLFLFLPESTRLEH